MQELEKLKKLIVSCKKCPLYKTRTNAVPGEGPADAMRFPKIREKMKEDFKKLKKLILRF